MRNIMKLIAHSLKKTFIHMVVITIMGVVVYSNTLYNPFMFDDAVNIVENPIIKDFEHFKDNVKVYKSTAMGGIKDFFRTRYIGYLSFVLNYRLHGLNVFGYHLVNIAIHIINALLVYWLIMLSFKTPFFKGSMFDANSSSGHNRRLAGLIAFFSSLIFVAHPIQTQAVTYIVQRFASLATLFYLLSLIFYIKSRITVVSGQQSAVSIGNSNQRARLKKWVYYCGSVISAVLAMKTKEISFTLPVMIAIYEFMFFEGKIKKRLFYLIPIILTMAIIPLTLITNPSFITNPSLESRNIDDAFKIASSRNGISSWDYLITQFSVIVTYIRLMFPPVEQNLDYDYPIYKSFFEPQVLLSFLLLLSIFGLGIYLFYRSRFTSHVLRLTAFGIFWFFITLSVESSIIPIDDVIFEHRVYLPSVGFIIAVITFLMVIKSKLKKRFASVEKAIIPALAAIVLILAGAAYARNTIWQDEIKLWEDVVKKSPNKAGPHNNLGRSYVRKCSRLNEAAEELQLALLLKPDMLEAHNNLGTVYLKQGHFNEAVEKFLFVLKRNPYYFKAHNNLGLAYLNLNRFDEAAKSLKNVIKLNPDYADAYYNLGLVYEKQGKTDEALKEYRIATELKPDLIVMHNNLGVNYFKEGKLDEAIRSYEILIRLKPDFVQAHYNLGLAYKAQRRFDEAAHEFEIAFRLKPDDKTKKNIEAVHKELKRKS